MGREGREARMGQSTGRSGRIDGLSCSLRSRALRLTNALVNKAVNCATELQFAYHCLREQNGWEVARGVILGDEWVQSEVQKVGS